jgi:hypothetical protein
MELLGFNAAVADNPLNNGGSSLRLAARPARYKNGDTNLPPL